VFAADPLRTAPGGHSRYVTARLRVAPSAKRPARFVDEIARIVGAHDIDLIVPIFEEVFCLARHAADLPPRAALLAADFESLARLHHKGTFNALGRELSIPVPATALATTSDELLAATRHRRYFARPAWSRGGLEVLTNAGPLAGLLALDDCRPTPAHPWVVQEFVDGVDLCTFSVARRGRVVAHCAYVHPREIEHDGGIVFESVSAPDSLRYVERIVEATRYHGQLGIDFRRTPRGLVALECNPRPTAGVHLMADALFVDAVVGAPASAPRVVAAGTRRMYASALIRDLMLHRGDRRQNLAYLLSGTQDVYSPPDDRLPALFQVLSYLPVLLYRARHPWPPRPGTGLVAATFDGIAWDGEPIP
jgi:predicted ATP-grasp superfamily ATP-dependent carboligase